MICIELCVAWIALSCVSCVCCTYLLKSCIGLKEKLCLHRGTLVPHCNVKSSCQSHQLIDIWQPAMCKLSLLVEPIRADRVFVSHHCNCWGINSPIAEVSKNCSRHPISHIWYCGAHIIWQFGGLDNDRLRWRGVCLFDSLLPNIA